VKKNANKNRKKTVIHAPCKEASPPFSMRGMLRRKEVIHGRKQNLFQRRASSNQGRHTG
jgi:hypothetical protein